ncbi:MAG: FxLYD domain-containing protein, partial [Planctomycetota bacterium]
YLAKEVGQINEKLTKRMDELEEKLTNLEKAPPVSASATGEPYTPPPPPQKRFEVGDLHLGSGFTAYKLAYETTEKGTTFTGEIKNGSSAPVEWVEFEITVFDEDNKLIGAKRFRVTNLHVGESTPFDETVKGPEAHWIKKYEIQFLRRS